MRIPAKLEHRGYKNAYIVGPTDRSSALARLALQEIAEDNNCTVRADAEEVTIVGL